jgi:hypothetical protein
MHATSHHTTKTNTYNRYLEQKDPAVHQQVKAIIKDCAERNKRHERGYESVTASMKARLKEVVSETYWQRAEQYLKHFLQEKSKRSSSAAAAAAAGNNQQPGGQQLQQQPPSGANTNSTGGGASSGANAVEMAKQAEMERKNREMEKVRQINALRKQQQQQAAAAKRKQQAEMRQAAALQAQQQQQQQLQPSAANNNAKTGGSSKYASQQQQQSAAAAAAVPSVVAAATAVATAAAATTTATSSRASTPSKGGAAAKKSKARGGGGGKTPTMAQQRKNSTAAATNAATAAAAVAAANAAAASAVAKASATSAAAAATATTNGAPATTPGVSVAAATAAAELPSPEIIKEYEEYMNMVDHAVNFSDWTSTALILGQKTHALMSEEQHQLLYSSIETPRMSSTKQSAAIVPERSANSFPRPGWSRRNLISARTVWAKVRLREKNVMAKEGLAPPVVGAGGLFLTLPTARSPSSSVSQVRTMPATSWYNEDVAEEDATLAVISEATQVYLKSILEKAIHASRQRQNLDGIRLWHRQVISSTAGSAAGSAAGGKDGGGKSKTDKKSSSKKQQEQEASEQEPPPLSIRLGCDVQRQLARAQGNAALTVKRMEEALERQSGVPLEERILSEETLCKATSMSEVALRPRLAKAVEHAEWDGKRSFEVYGGKDAATEPPLGRVPKIAKLEVQDFQMGMTIGTRPGRYRAAAVSAFFQY